MTFRDKSSAESAISHFEHLEFEHTWCAVQDGFETFTLAIRNNLKAEVSNLIPDIVDRPFKELHMIQLVIGFGAPREGARALASLWSDSDAPSSSQVDYDRLWRVISSMNRPNTSIHKHLRETLERLPYMDDVLTYAGNSLSASLLEKMPLLMPHEEHVRQMIFLNLMYGVKMEFAFPLIARESREEISLMRRLLQTEKIQKSDMSVAMRLKEMFGITDEKLPWPADMMCICGNNLTQQPGCCGSGREINIEIDQLNPDYLLKMPCCGAAVVGLRCESCARYFSWTVGIVPSASS